MKRKLVILPRAEQDAQQIFDWLRERSPHGAANWWRAFELAATNAVNDHERFAEAYENKSVNYHLQQVFFATRKGQRYRFVFTVIEDEFRILRVRGSGQPSLQQDELRLS